MSKLKNSNKLEIKQLHLIISICRRELSWHLCAHTNGKLGYKCHPIRIKTKYLIGIPDPVSVGGERRRQEPIYPCASQHQQPAVYLRNPGPVCNRGTQMSGNIASEGFMFHIELPLLTSFRRQNKMLKTTGHRDCVWWQCNMDTMIYVCPLSMILARPHHTHHMSSTVYLYITISHGPGIQNMTNYSYNRGKSVKNNA